MANVSNWKEAFETLFIELGNEIREAGFQQEETKQLAQIITNAVNKVIEESEQGL